MYAINIENRFILNYYLIEARCTTSGDRCALPFNYKGEVYKSCTDIFSITGTLMCPFQFNGRIGVGECTICQGSISHYRVY